MRVLITGGSGFLGAWIIRRLLARDIACRVMDLSRGAGITEAILGAAAERIEWLPGDVVDGESLAAAAQGCDALIHLAGVLTPGCQTDPVRGAEVNVIGTINAFTAAIRNGIGRVVYTSSISVFGPDGGSDPQPTTHYGTFKLANEGSARAFWDTDHVTSFGIRPGVVYGAGRETGLTAGITQACRHAAAGQDYAIPFSGEVNLVYVDEVAATYEAALLSDRTGAHVVGTYGRVEDVEAVAAEIRRQVQGAAIRVEGPPLPFPPVRVPETDILAGIPRPGLADGIAATLAHYGQAERA